MKNIGGLLIVFISFTLFFLKIYTPWPYICLVIIGMFVSYKNFIVQNGSERTKETILKVLGISVIAVVYWYYFNW